MTGAEGPANVTPPGVPPRPPRPPRRTARAAPRVGPPPLNTFGPGWQSPVVFFPIDVSGAPQIGQVLQITGHTGDWTGVLSSVKHTGTEGHEARIGCGDDFKATVNADFDLGAPPFEDPPFVVPQAPGVIRVYLASDYYHEFGVRVSRIHWQTPVNDKVSYSFDVEMDWLSWPYTIGQTGLPDASTPPVALVAA